MSNPATPPPPPVPDSVRQMILRVVVHPAPLTALILSTGLVIGSINMRPISPKTARYQFMETTTSPNAPTYIYKIDRYTGEAAVLSPDHSSYDGMTTWMPSENSSESNSKPQKSLE